MKFKALKILSISVFCSLFLTLTSTINFPATGSECFSRALGQPQVLISGSSCSGVVTIPNGITDIADDAFKNNTEITRVILPSTIERIGNRAFLNTTNLISVEFGFNLQRIGSDAFNSTPSLQSVTFKGRPISNHDYDFPGREIEIIAYVENEYAPNYGGFGSLWRNLRVKPHPPIFTLSSTSQSINFGQSIVSSIIDSTGGDIYAYELICPPTIECICPTTLQCNGIEISGFPIAISGTPIDSISGARYEIKATNPSGEYSQFFELTVAGSTASAPVINELGQSDSRIYVNDFTPPLNPGGRVVNYKYSLNGGPYIAFSPAVTSTPMTISGLINDVEYEVRIKAVNSSGDGEASPVSELTRITPRSCVNVEEGVATYQSCRGEVVIPNSVIEIAPNLFLNNSEVTSVTIPNSVKSIGTSAFSSMSNLERVVIGSSVEEIGDSAFYNTPIRSLSIPNSVKKIGNNAFANLILLTTLNLGQNLEEIGDYAFQQAFNLRNVTIPSSVQSIGRGAFTRYDDSAYNFYFEGNAPLVLNGSSSAFQNGNAFINDDALGFREEFCLSTLWEINYFGKEYDACSWRGLTIKRKAPTISSLGPISGAPTGGTEVLITGQNFTQASSVKFGEIEAISFTIENSRRIKAISPSQPNGGVKITVTTRGGTGTSFQDFTYETPSSFTTSVTSSESTTISTPIKINGADVNLRLLIPAGLKTGKDVTLNVGAGTNAINVSGVQFTTISISASVVGEGALTEFDQPISITLPRNFLSTAIPMFTRGDGTWISITETTDAGIADKTFMGTASTLYRRTNSEGVYDVNGDYITIYSLHLTEFGYRKAGSLSILAGASRLETRATTSVTSTREAGDLGAVTYSASGACSISTLSETTVITAAELPGTCTVGASKAAYNEFSNASSNTVLITVTASSTPSRREPRLNANPTPTPTATSTPEPKPTNSDNSKPAPKDSPKSNDLGITKPSVSEIKIDKDINLKNSEIKLRSASGQEVKGFKIKISSGNKITVTLPKGTKPGIYKIQIKTADGKVITKRIVIKKK